MVVIVAITLDSNNIQRQLCRLNYLLPSNGECCLPKVCGIGVARLSP